MPSSQRFTIRLTATAHKQVQSLVGQNRALGSVIARWLNDIATAPIPHTVALRTGFRVKDGLPLVGDVPHYLEIHYQYVNGAQAVMIHGVRAEPMQGPH